MVFGSVSTGVLHNAKCPVLVVPPADHTAAGEPVVVGAEERS